MGIVRTVRALRDLESQRYPRFVRDDTAREDIGVPVFTYHSVANASVSDAVSLAEFERDMRHLVKNGYHTLHADELYEHLVSGQPVPPRSVLLTFDDGRASLWTAAYPILRRYGLRAVSFLVPGRITDGTPRPKLDEAKTHGARAQALAVDLSEQPTITWDEARAMHASGLIDFQSHTMEHALVFNCPRIVDYVRGPPTAFAGFDVPTVRDDRRDLLHSPLPLGTPIYAHSPRMCAARRFFDDERLRQRCAAHVGANGGARFFSRKNWRKELDDIVEAYRQDHEIHESYESPTEQEQALRASLLNSKHKIEEMLPGHSVRHLCYPWNRYSVLAATLAREAGYISAFIDINPQKPAPNWNDPYALQRFLPINEFGDDPFQITRIDARNDMVLSLPGSGRRSYRQRLFRRLFRLPRLLER